MNSNPDTLTISLSREDRDDLKALLDALAERRVYTILMEEYPRKDRLIALLDRFRRRIDASNTMRAVI